MKAMDTLSIKMLNTLRKGKEKLSREAQERIRQYIVSQRADEVFFMDKSRKGDIYYTAFGLMLSCLFDLSVDTRKARLQLEKQQTAYSDLIHYVACFRSLMLIERMRYPDLILLVKMLTGKKQNVPAFIAFPHNDSRSPYSRFIWLSLMEDRRQRVGNTKEILESLKAYKVPSGGYSNISGGMSASVNATAAALSVKGQLEGYNIREEVDYLYQAQEESGGFCATRETPLPDILTTATALFVLRCYGVEPRIRPDSFIEAHWLESGGFSPTILEEIGDIEYTFYGLLALGTC